MQVKEPIGGQLEILSKSDVEKIHGATMEVLGMVARTLRGIEVNDETLAVDEIVKVGPFANYLGTPSLRMYRKEHYVPELLEMLGHVECAPVNPV